MPNGFHIEWERSEAGPKALILFDARYDVEFGEALRKEIFGFLEEGVRDFEIDLRQVEACNSITLGVLVGLHSTIRRHEGRMVVIVRNGTHVLKMFVSLKLDQVINFRVCEGKVRVKKSDADENRTGAPITQAPVTLDRESRAKNTTITDMGGRRTQIRETNEDVRRNTNTKPGRFLDS